MPNTTQISIRRSVDTIQTFDVPHHEGMSILDALKHISTEQSPDLAYRWECSQGVCGVCTMLINGRPALSCAVTAQPGTEYLLEPLPGFPIKKDLVIDLTPRLNGLLDVQPYLVDGGRAIETYAEAEASKKVRSCIECWGCVSVCPVSLNTDNADALSMVKLARFALDPRDGADRAEIAAAHGLDTYSATCPTCRRCMDVCPKGIDVYIDAIKVLENA